MYSVHVLKSCFILLWFIPFSLCRAIHFLPYKKHRRKSVKKTLIFGRWVWKRVNVVGPLSANVGGKERFLYNAGNSGNLQENHSNKKIRKRRGECEGFCGLPLPINSRFSILFCPAGASQSTWSAGAAGSPVAMQPLLSASPGPEPEMAFVLVLSVRLGSAFSARTESISAPTSRELQLRGWELEITNFSVPGYSG